MNSSRGGFTLLEVLLAMAVFAGGVFAASSLVQGSLRLASSAMDLDGAVLYASQRMEEAMLSPEVSPGTQTGVFGDRYRWVLSVEPLPGMPESRVEAYSVSVSVSWGEEGSVRTETVRSERWLRKDRYVRPMR